MTNPTPQAVDGGALPAEPQTQPDAETYRLWIDIIREARLLNGRDAARRLWAKSPLPTLPPAAKPARSPKPIPDWVGQFVTDRTEPARGVRLRVDRLWAAYLAWVPRGQTPVSEQTLMRHLGRYGLTRRTDRFAYFMNLRLRGQP